jgi:superfamily II DNA or RNA helicase
MATAVALNALSKETQTALTKRFTYRSVTRVRGEKVLGAPFPGFLVHASQTHVALPKAAATSCVPSRAHATLTLAVNHPELQFTGTLQESPDRDQHTAMAEAQDHLHTHGTTLLALRTGFGKTVCAGYLATSVCRQRTLVLVCREALLKQWVAELTSTTNAVVSLSKPKESTQILVCTPGTLGHVPTPWLQGIGTLILDEAVDFCTPGRLPPVLSITPNYIIACTATPTRPDGLHCILEDIIGSHRVVRSNTTSFNVTRLLTGYHPTTIQNEQGVDWTALQYDLFFSHERNYCLIRTLSDAVEAGHKVLVLTAYTGHVDLLMLLLEDAQIEASRFDGQRKSYTNARVLIGNTKKVGIGFDEKSHCEDFDGERIDLLVLACSTKQFEVLQQYVGRVVGRAEMPSVVHLVDEDNRIKGSHWRVAKSWYESNKGHIHDRKWTENVPHAWKTRHATHAKSVLDRLVRAKDSEDTSIVSYLKWLREHL